VPEYHRRVADGDGIDKKLGAYVQNEEAQPAGLDHSGVWQRSGPALRIDVPAHGMGWAMAFSRLITSGLPTSPAWMIRSEPCSAVIASGRISPCVSEIMPTRMVAYLWARQFLT
jgi:hypothetical protein